MKIEQIIKSPVITEKAARSKEATNEYQFLVDKKANKNQIRLAVEKMFNVKVITLRTLNAPTKKKRVGRWYGESQALKKAMVVLRDKDTIKLFEGA